MEWTQEIDAAYSAFLAADSAEREAERVYHVTTPAPEKSTERYAAHMMRFWDDTARAYAAFRKAGGRLGA